MVVSRDPHPCVPEAKRPPARTALAWLVPGGVVAWLSGGRLALSEHQFALVAMAAVAFAMAAVAIVAVKHRR
jgi:hypothetical protein